MTVNCEAKECKNNCSGQCNAESISIVDIEENKNIKMKDSDYMACKSFEWKWLIWILLLKQTINYVIR